MGAEPETIEIPASEGDWHIRGLSAEQKFAINPIRDDCVDAANRAVANFDSFFPGWQLYSRLIRQDTCFDRQIAAWAIGLARGYTRAHKLNGHQVVAPRARRPDWVATAGLDAVAYVIHHQFPETAYGRGQELGVRDVTYKKVRNHVTGAMLMGFDNFTFELHFHLYAVERENRENANYFLGNCENQPIWMAQCQ